MTNYCCRPKGGGALSQRQTIITLGDLNIDRLKRNLSTDGKILIDLEDVFDLTCLINEPTRVTPTSQTLVDVILTNKPESTPFAGVTDFGLSDHRIVLLYVLLKSKVKRHTAKMISFRSVKNINNEQIRKDVKEAMESLLLQARSQDFSWGGGGGGGGAYLKNRDQIINV